jgi:hypothetical protein
MDIEDVRLLRFIKSKDRFRMTEGSLIVDEIPIN